MSGDETAPPPEDPDDARPLPGGEDALGEDEAASWRFVAIVLVTAVLVLAGVGAVNITVDPMAEWDTRRFRASVIRHRDLRVRALTSPFREPPRCLVLGSSRAWKVEPEFVEEVTGLSTLVAAVDDAHAEDHLALLRFALEEAKAPLELVLLQVDVAAFLEDPPAAVQLLRHPRLAPYLPPGIPVADHLAPWLDAFGMPRLLESLASLSLYQRGYPEPRIRIRDDGFVVYVEREAQLRDGNFDLEHRVHATTEHMLKILGDAAELSPRRLGYLDELLRIAAARGIPVRAWLPPTHPHQREAMARRSHYPALEEKLVAALEARATPGGMAFLDATDLAAYGADPDAFYDGIHPREEVNRAFLGPFLEGRGARALQ